MKCCTAACALILLLAGCGGGGAPPAPVPARTFEDPGFVAHGRYELRYGVVPASSLPAEVAAAYGIAARGDRLVINVSILERHDGNVPAAIEAEVAGTWRSLAGEAKTLHFHALSAGGAVSYVAEAPLLDREPIVLELQATPAGATTPLRARLTRRFDAG